MDRKNNNSGKIRSTYAVFGFHSGLHFTTVILVRSHLSKLLPTRVICACGFGTEDLHGIILTTKKIILIFSNQSQSDENTLFLLIFLEIMYPIVFLYFK